MVGGARLGRRIPLAAVLAAGCAAAALAGAWAPAWEAPAPGAGAWDGSAAGGPGAIAGAWAQAADTLPTLGVRLADTPPHHYKDSEGRTSVVGQVVNTNSFAVSGVKVRIGFYGASGDEPVETAIGTTLAGVVPAGGTAPFAISSESPSAAITDATVTILGFNYADEKPRTLAVEGTAAVAAQGGGDEEGPRADRLAVAGTISNAAPHGSPAEGPVTIHMLQYDAFDPPRLLRHASAALEGPLEAGASAEFSIDDALLVRADGVHLFAESPGASSNTADVPIAQSDPVSRRVTIGGAHLSDADGNRVQGGREGSPLVVAGDLSLESLPSAQEGAQEYTFYVQVKRSGDSPSVEFLGSSGGRFDGPGTASPSVEWTPDEEGLYFVETFVWDSDNSPLASRGPVVLVLVSGG